MQIKPDIRLDFPIIHAVPINRSEGFEELNYSPPSYNPPYDSPIEDIFAYTIVKHLDEQIALVPQVEVNTICGTFRLDFVVYSLHGEKIAFECDGREYHDESHDEWRDAMILGDRIVTAIYRLPGNAIYYHMDDMLYLISLFDAQIFSNRGILNLNSLASDSAKHHERCPYNDCAEVIYNGKRTKRFRVERRHQDKMDKFTRGLYKLAREIGGGSLADVETEWRRRHMPNID